MMQFKTAIKMLEREYEKARKLDYIQNPVAYALYQVWREADASWSSNNQRKKNLSGGDSNGQ